MNIDKTKIIKLIKDIGFYTLILCLIPLSLLIIHSVYILEGQTFISLLILGFTVDLVIFILVAIILGIDQMFN